MHYALYTRRYVLCPLARARVVAALACEAFFLVMAWASPPLIIVIILFILIILIVLIILTNCFDVSKMIAMMIFVKVVIDSNSRL